jgi:long-chain acyl-CoA synthetase
MNPAIWLQRQAQLRPKAPALYRGIDLIADYAAFAERAAQIAAGLQARGITAGDRIAVLMKNRVEYLEVLYGIWWLGAAAVPINAKLHAKEVAYILEDSGATLMYCCADTTVVARDAAAGGDVPILSVDETAYGALGRGCVAQPPAVMGRDDMVWLFYTSGTTGRPKGVMISAGNILAMIAGYHDSLTRHKSQDATLYAAPMSHGAGLYNFMFVLAGARHICPASGRFEGTEIFELAAHHQHVTMFAAPTMVTRMVALAQQTGVAGDGLDTLIYAGGPMYLSDIELAVQVLGNRFAQIYGQGECPMAITALPKEYVTDRTHPRWRARLAGVGHAQMVSALRIVDATGAEQPAGVVGEITVRGPAVMPGYWKNAVATAEAIREGWLWTGDMGSLDDDGFLTLQDRSKDMIISGGSNIYPREVEEVLLTHVNVAEVAVIGWPHSDWGEEVVACIVPVPGCRLERDALDQICLENIARFKRPKRYVILTSLPKNNYGKVLKTALRQHEEVMRDAQVL